RPRGDLLRQGRDVQGSTADDEPGRRPDRGQDRQDHSRLSAVREGGADDVGPRAAGQRSARPGGRLRRPAARGLAGPPRRRGSHPMHRLLQGDVGAGKTVVAVTTLLMAVQGGYQGALMAPTEVLAEQHELGVRDLLRDLQVPDTDPGTMFGERPLTVALLTNRTTAKERERLQAGLADGSVDILIGTHALIEEGVAFKSLGAIVIDEQHRFGV